MSVERPTVWIGKHGASKETLTEIDRQLEKAEVVKVRILKPAIEGNEPEAIAEKTARSTQSVIVDVRGHTFVLFRKKREDAQIAESQ